MPEMSSVLAPLFLGSLDSKIDSSISFLFLSSRSVPSGGELEIHDHSSHSLDDLFARNRASLVSIDWWVAL